MLNTARACIPVYGQAGITEASSQGAVLLRHCRTDHLACAYQRVHVQIGKLPKSRMLEVDAKGGSGWQHNMAASSNPIEIYVNDSR